MELLIHKQEIKEEEDDLKSYSEEVAPEEVAEDDEQEGKKRMPYKGRDIHITEQASTTSSEEMKWKRCIRIGRESSDWARDLRTRVKDHRLFEHKVETEDRYVEAMEGSTDWWNRR